MAAGIQRPASCPRPSNSAESGGWRRAGVVTDAICPKNNLNVHISNDLPRACAQEPTFIRIDRNFGSTQSRSAQAPLYERMPREVHGGANAAFVS